MDEKLLKSVKEKAQEWLTEYFDEQTRQDVQYLLDHDETELIDAFYRDLEFGTGGLRGIMGVGTNRINSYTIGMTTQGLCNYLKKEFSGSNKIKVAIAHDSRNNSRTFAENTAKIFSANNIQVFLFDDLRPVPELSFTIRHLNCHAGVVITASHNPKEYNGYKVYWKDGGQIVPPHDKNIIEQVRKITSVNQINFNTIPENIQTIGDEIDNIYLEKIKNLSLNPGIIHQNNDIKIVFTPIHGTGTKLVPEILSRIGFKNVFIVEKQAKPDGNFPTVESPNPEETAALDMAIAKAREIDADIVMGTDPDADRVGIAVKNHKNEYILLNGNQTGALLINYILSQYKSKGLLKGNEFIVKTIVTSKMIKDIADNYSVECFDVYTGFKNIAEIIRKNENKKQFIVGGEESYGYLVNDFVRDKDAVISCAMLAESLAYAKHNHSSLFDELLNIYVKFGFYKEYLMSLKKKGKQGAEDIHRIMQEHRDSPPEFIKNKKVIKVYDYLKQVIIDKRNNSTDKIDLPKADVLQFILEDDSKISMRPSGTEPKIKFYFSVKKQLSDKNEFEKVEKQLDDYIETLKSYFASL
ncbi:MAG: phospho-sugar mutase [Bacteroidota bacterium]